MAMRFICTNGSLVKGPTQLVEGRCYRVGRSSKCAFMLVERSVSRVHAEVEVHENAFLIKDLDSRNGTYVNGDKVKQAELKPGQSVFFGAVMFQLVAGDVPAAAEDGDTSSASTFIVRPRAKRSLAKLRALLSEAEHRVLDWLIKGFAEKEVAAQLDLSTHTVHNHVKAIYRKFHVKSRSELLAMFLAEDDVV